MDDNCSPENPADNIKLGTEPGTEKDEIVTEELLGTVAAKLNEKLAYVLLKYKIRHDVPEDRFCLAEDIVQEVWAAILLQIRAGERLKLHSKRAKYHGIFSYAVKTGYYVLQNYRRKWHEI